MHSQADYSAMESSVDAAKRLERRQRSLIRMVAGCACEHEAAMQAERVSCHTAIDDKTFPQYTSEQCVIVLASLIDQDDKRRRAYSYSVNPTEPLLGSSSQRLLQSHYARLKVLRDRHRRLQTIWAGFASNDKRASKYQLLISKCVDEIQSKIVAVNDLHQSGGPSVGIESHGVWNYVDHLLKVSLDHDGIAIAKQRGTEFIERATTKVELTVVGDEAAAPQAVSEIADVAKPNEGIDRASLFDDAISDYRDSQWKQDKGINNRAWRVRQGRQKGEIFGDGDRERGWCNTKSKPLVIRKANDGNWTYLTASHTEKLQKFFSGYG